MASSLTTQVDFHGPLCKLCISSFDRRPFDLPGLPTSVRGKQDPDDDYDDCYDDDDDDGDDDDDQIMIMMMIMMMLMVMVWLYNCSMGVGYFLILCKSLKHCKS